ncbi:MAG: adenylosuccinate synthetase [Promethearchaeati archaeon SRVP18_Atabeyarchaeia-1]
MPCTVIVGGFFGDEGKGKIVAYLSVRDRPAIVARAGVGTNAGHSFSVGGTTVRLRQVPSGFPYEKARLLIGPGVLVDPSIFFDEIEKTKVRGRIGVDRQCAIIERQHIDRDKQDTHLSSKVGTTGSGTGPCNADRALRLTKLARDIPELKEFLADTSKEANDALDKGNVVIVEGTQGTFLSLFHGTYPYCTSKDVCASGACADVGIGPTRIDDVLVVFKSFVTRVGAGELPGELNEDETKRRGWTEYGTVTGRLRRAAPFNFDLARRAAMLNGATKVAITKLDVLFPQCKDAKSEEDLPREALAFIKEIEEKIKVPVAIVGTGADIDSTIDRRGKIPRRRAR